MRNQYDKKQFWFTKCTNWNQRLENSNWEVADDNTHQELSFLLETPKQIFNRILMYFEHKYFSYR